MRKTLKRKTTSDKGLDLARALAGVNGHAAARETDARGVAKKQSRDFGFEPEATGRCGETCIETVRAGATAGNGKPRKAVNANAVMAAISKELQSLQRNRAIVLKSRNMQANRLQAIVAGTLGYQSNMPYKERAKKFLEATALIKRIAKGEGESNLREVVKVTLVGIDSFNQLKDALEKEMKACAKKLPAAAWVEKPEQRGFGLLFLAIVIGETGDLANYANPAKVWRRLGCAPWSFGGKTAMGATWRAGKEGKLPSAEWESFGYSPRRRSIAYLIGEGIVKQNGGETKIETDIVSAAKNGASDGVIEIEAVNARSCGPYRRRYDEAKAKAHVVHPDWTPKRCHLHGMLLATKLLLKNLWIEWNGAANSSL